MTAISHHPAEDILFRYASGALGAGWDLGVAVHLAACPACRRAVADFEAAAGAELEIVAPLALSPAVDPAVLLARAELAPAPEPAAASADAWTPVFPQPLRAIAGDLPDIRWSAVGGGVRQKIVLRDGDVTARLLHIGPGVAVPAHGHGGLEFTAVLGGGYFDGAHTFRRGDIQIVAHAAPHQPIAMRDAPCICLAVTDAPLRFRDLLPRLVQRIARI